MEKLQLQMKKRQKFLAKVFKNIHSNNNLSEEARNNREKVKGDNPDITKKCKENNR